ncbi:type IV pilus secretin PilQ [Acinetobacter rathckeae]|uniref:type IV pilus secretin PilQ n=1 Tax=Acinetobacter rathckeae TaxID=2605272 RepID=UPI0018A30FED|nr:type IV pilus secretin PilQ [Acinetobacter rathckeae]MBF7688708.1 type IV pilus secretin PilQ [Acinetobacter rathckeae]MBF7696101.1 type IV pilus secretin PilQ [Acinetobacter rathckeae]
MTYSRVCRLVLGAVLFSSSLSAMQLAQALAITSVTANDQGNQNSEVRIVFDGKPVDPKAYQIGQMPKLILDFPKTEMKVTAAQLAKIHTSQLERVALLSQNQQSRLSLDLKENAQFSSRIEGSTYILSVTPKSPNVSVSTSVEKQPTNTVQQPQASAKQLTQGVANIGFQRSEKGDGQIVIDLLDGHTPVDIQQRSNYVVIRLIGNKIPTHLIQRMDVNDFATPVSTIDSFNDGANGIIEIKNVGAFDYKAYQTEKKLTINVARKDSTENKSLNESKYTGRKLSLDFQDIEVRRVLQVLSDFSGVNIIAADSVQGNITLRLKDVPSDQALDLILKAKNLSKKQIGEVIWVMPTMDMIKADEEEAKLKAQQRKDVALQTEFIQLNYIKVKQLEDIFDLKNKGQDRKENNPLLTPRGSAVLDPRTNTIVLTDTPEKIQEVRKLFKQLDTAVKQVMVEARIVRTETNFSKDLGVNWSLSQQTSTSGWDNGKITRSISAGVDLGTTTNYGSLSLGLLRLGSNMLDLKLAASQSDGQSEILSTPKVMTGDNQEATIRSGQKVPYATTSGNNGTTITFQDAVLELKVTPSITPDGKIQMQLNISKDSLGVLTTAGYAIDTNELKTNVLVADGETVVLGGLYENTSINQTNKVPLLGDLPGVGHLFKNNTKSDIKRELLIFITPRIVNDTF